MADAPIRKNRARDKRPLIIQDEMRKRSIQKKTLTQFVARFQTRYFILYSDRLVYMSKDGTDEKGSISTMSIKLCEDVEYNGFQKSHVFQIGYIEKGKMFHLYIQAGDKNMKEKWKSNIRLICSKYNERMFEWYHKEPYLKKMWACCHKTSQDDSGCTRVTHIYKAPGEKLNRPGSTVSAASYSPNLDGVPNKYKSRVRDGRRKLPSEYLEEEAEVSDYHTESSHSSRHNSLERGKKAAGVRRAVTQYTASYHDDRLFVPRSVPDNVSMLTRVSSCQVETTDDDASSCSTTVNDEKDVNVPKLINARLNSQGSSVVTTSSDTLSSISRTHSDCEKPQEFGRNDSLLGNHMRHYPLLSMMSGQYVNIRDQSSSNQSTLTSSTAHEFWEEINPDFNVCLQQSNTDKPI